MAVAAMERTSVRKHIPKSASVAKVLRGVKPMNAVVARRSDLDGSDADLDMTRIGGRLSYARLRADMTQDALGDAIDKVRGTIVAYESNKIMPPISVVEELARVLNVSPSFLAFGEHGVKMSASSNAAEATINIDEITYGRDGSYTSGVFAMSRELAESYVDAVRDLRAFVMVKAAPAFGMREGDRAFADISVKALSNEFDEYLVEVPGGMDMVRIAPTFTKSPTVLVEGPRGDKTEVKARDLKIIGAVVSTLKHK